MNLFAKQISMARPAPIQSLSQFILPISKNGI